MLTGLVVLLLALLAVLSIPITLSYQVSWHHAFRGKFILCWLFGLVRVPIRLPGKEPSPAEGQKRRSHTDTGKRPSRNSPNFSAAIRQKPFRRRLVQFMSDVWKAIGKKNLHLRLRIGLGDPADTGQLWALMGPLAGILANTREASIELEPEFSDEIFEVDSSGDIRLVPIQILYLTVALLLSAPVRRAVRQTWKKPAP